MSFTLFVYLAVIFFIKRFMHRLNANYLACVIHCVKYFKEHEASKVHRYMPIYDVCH